MGLSEVVGARKKREKRNVHVGLGAEDGEEDSKQAHTGRFGVEDDQETRDSRTRIVSWRGFVAEVDDSTRRNKTYPMRQ